MQRRVYPVKFLGSVEVSKPKGTDVVKEAIAKMKVQKSVKKAEGIKVPKMDLMISMDGIILQSAKTKENEYDFPLHLISFVADDKNDKRKLAFVVKEPAKSARNGAGSVDKHYCYVFDSNKCAAEISLTIGQAFDLAYQKFLEDQKRQDKKRPMELAGGVATEDVLNSADLSVLRAEIVRLRKENASLRAGQPVRNGISAVLNGHPTTPPSSAPPVPLAPPASSVPPTSSSNAQLIDTFDGRSSSTVNAVEETANRTGSAGLPNRNEGAHHVPLIPGPPPSSRQSRTSTAGSLSATTPTAMESSAPTSTTTTTATTTMASSSSASDDLRDLTIGAAPAPVPSPGSFGSVNNPFLADTFQVPAQPVGQPHDPFAQPYGTPANVLMPQPIGQVQQGQQGQQIQQVAPARLVDSANAPLAAGAPFNNNPFAGAPAPGVTTSASNSSIEAGFRQGLAISSTDVFADLDPLNTR